MRSQHRTGRRRPVPRLCLAGVLLGVTGAVWGDPTQPFTIRNLNPLTSIFGLPAWRALEPGGSVAVTTELANHYRFSRRGPEALVLDGETWRTGLAVERAFGERWGFGLEVPYYRQSGGVLDDVIDAWHSAFGLPDGARNLRPEGEIEYALANGGSAFLAVDRGQRGLGDAQLGVARRIGANGAYTVRATMKLPTGDEAILAGSGATDWSLTLLRAYAWQAGPRPAGLFWGIGAVALGDPDRIEFDARSAGYLGIVGGGWQLGRRFGLKAQLDVHSALYDSRLEEIGKTAIQATVGAWLDVGRRGLLELAIVEDVAVSTSPDIVLHATLRWAWSRPQAAAVIRSAVPAVQRQVDVSSR